MDQGFLAHIYSVEQQLTAIVYLSSYIKTLNSDRCVLEGFYLPHSSSCIECKPTQIKAEPWRLNIVSTELFHIECAS